jgi:hypothetical protein
MTRVEAPFITLSPLKPHIQCRKQPFNPSMYYVPSLFNDKHGGIRSVLKVRTIITAARIVMIAEGDVNK